MNEQKVRWDDLQIVLAIVESGSLSGAGRRLGVSHATVFRRLTDMEQHLRVTLFHRAASGYTPTAAGEDLAASAAVIQNEVHGAERRILGRDLRLSGTLRVTTTDSLFSGLVAQAAAHFRKHQPDIDLEIVISNQIQSLTKREADIAIRPTKRPPEMLIGRQAGPIKLAVYGHRDQWHNTSSPVTISALSHEPWIGPENGMGDTSITGWMNEHNFPCQYRLDSICGIQSALRTGAGVGLLPCYLGDSDPQIVRVSAPIPELATELWLLTHPDYRRVARVRAFMETIGETLSKVLRN